MERSERRAAIADYVLKRPDGTRWAAWLERHRVELNEMTAPQFVAGREWEAEVKKASEYRQHAEECRALAKSMPVGKDRDQLLGMAATWDNLAAERSKLVQRHPELAIRGEHEEEIQRTNKV